MQYSPPLPSCRSLGRISVQCGWSPSSGWLPVEATVGRYPAVVDRTRPHPIPRKLPQKTMRSTGVSGITTRFQELFRCIGGVGHALLTRSPLTTKQSLMDPVRLACVKHAASVFILSQNRTSTKNFMKSIRIDDSQNKIDEHRPKEGRPQKPPSPLIKPPGTQPPRQAIRRGNELAIIDYKEVVQTRLLSSQTTTTPARTGNQPEEGTRRAERQQVNKSYTHVRIHANQGTQNPRNRHNSAVPSACRTEPTLL